MSDPTATALRQAIDAFDAGTGPSPAREECAKIIDEMLEEAAFNQHPRVKLALILAARAVRRGRRLSPSEKLENVLRWVEDEGDAP